MPGVETMIWDQHVTCKEANRHKHHLLMESYSLRRGVFIKYCIHHHSFNPQEMVHVHVPHLHFNKDSTNVTLLSPPRTFDPKESFLGKATPV